MLLTKKVKYRGRMIDVQDLSPNTNRRIAVLCPECLEKRYTYYKAYRKAQSDLCLKCFNRINRAIEITQTKYGLLTVLSVKGKTVLCKCDCGNITNIPKHNLINGKTKSCGCIKQKNFINAKANKKENHGNWKGGISTEQRLIRTSVKYAKFRNNVFERDNYTCQKCGQIGRWLNVHHILPFALNKREIFNIENGITLCKDCHKIFHAKYGMKCDRKDLKNYLN